jgi:hypothetical protein
MKSFGRAGDNSFSAMGLDLKKRIALQVQFYQSMPPTTMEAIAVQGQSDSILGMDNFLRSSNRLYQTSKEF